MFTDHIDWVAEITYNSDGLAIAESDLFINKDFQVIEMIDLQDGGDWIVEWRGAKPHLDLLDKWFNLFPTNDPFSFDTANLILCQLVVYGQIAIQSNQKVAYATMKEGFLEESDNPVLLVAKTYRFPETYILKFEDNSAHFRIRNIRTDEIISGDAL